MLASAPDEQREQMEAAIEASIQKVRLEQAGEPVPEELAAAVAKADEALFAKLREQLGLDEAVAVNVGAAPTPVEVLEFFHAIGIELAELWGMSETCGAGACNPPGKVKIGTVGPPTRASEIKLADDGEILDPGPDRHARLPQPARQDRRGAVARTAGCTPATSASSTTTAT